MNHLEMLAEGLDYKGAHFTENWIFSNLVKAYYEDAEKYGAEEAKDMYLTLFGEELEEALDYINENYEYIGEAVGIDSPLLFEGYLGERAQGKGASAVSMAGQAAASGKAKGVLKGLWDKLKGLGSGALDKVKGLVEKGVPWAKELIQKGASFFASNPIAQVAVPAVALAGGAAAGWKLLKKMKKGKISDEDKQKYKEALQQKQDQVKKYVGSNKQNEEFHFKEKQELTEDVNNFELTPDSVRGDEEGPTIVEAKLYFETSSKSEDEVKEICQSSEFKDELEKLLKKYF